MDALPLGKRLKRRLHRSIALAQDLLVMEMYDSIPRAVIHGGTAIWRCYGSNRFSEDVDFYLPLKMRGENFEKLLEGLRGKGFTVEKFKVTESSVFSGLSYLGANVRFEAVFKNVKNFTTKDFELVDGNLILVNTLNPEDMIKEKILAYANRRKVRDLYDIFFLLKMARKDKVEGEALKLVAEFKKPVDEKELKAIIISGSIPSADHMMEVVRRWAE
jgi:predicted nucleotidyltransferase component of viral defense system